MKKQSKWRKALQKAYIELEDGAIWNARKAMYYIPVDTIEYQEWLGGSKTRTNSIWK